MPDFDGINVELHSQYNIPRQNITKIIEYAPPSQLRRESLYSGTSPSSGYIPEFWEDATRTLNVCVPVLPGANFWVTYWIENPYAHFPDRQYKIQGVEREEEYYVMKLFVGTTHLATWCCDEKQNWNGKTHYGLYEDPDPDRAKELRLDILGRSNEHMGIPRAPIGKKVLQKRMLCFTAPPPALEGDATGSLRGEKKVERRWSRDSMNKLRKRSNKRLPNEVLERYIELRIYRANGMKRIPTEVEGFDVAKFGGHLGKGLEYVRVDVWAF